MSGTPEQVVAYALLRACALACDSVDRVEAPGQQRAGLAVADIAMAAVLGACGHLGAAPSSLAHDLDKALRCIAVARCPRHRSDMARLALEAGEALRHAADIVEGLS